MSYRNYHINEIILHAALSNKFHSMHPNSKKLATVASSCFSASAKLQVLIITYWNRSSV